MNLAERWAALLRRLREEDRYRSLTAAAGVDFTSNDYLGYGSGRRAGPAAPGRPAGRCGLASRLLRGNNPVWEQVEAELARWHGAEAALVLTSGYAANEGLLATVIGADDWVASDALNHASIIDGLRLARAEKFVYRHNDLNHLEEGLLAAARSRPPGRQLFVVTESLFGMEGDVCPLAALAALAGRYEAHVIADEAHATGCVGPEGSGLVDAAGLRGRVLATVHTGGKALGVAGAYVCGSALLREVLVNRCRHFIFTTALPPAVGGWWLDALQRARADDAGRRALHGNAALFRGELARRGVAGRGDQYIIPVVLGADGTAVRAARALQDAGWDVRAIRPPTVLAGTARLRLAIHADHDRDTLLGAAAALGDVVNRLAAEAP
jgi:8-amino-7-oxononanoate synthase